MPAILGHEDTTQAIEAIYTYFYDLMNEMGYNSLLNMEDNGGQLLPQDEYLYTLVKKLTGSREPSFSQDEIMKLNNTIPDMERAGYPQELIDAMSGLHELLTGKRAKARKEARNILAANVAGLFRAGEGPELTAFNKVRGQPFFITEIASRLTNQPRAMRESEGGIGPVIRNLRQISRGRSPKPLRRTTRRNRSSSGRSRSRSASR
jgi:hypothetical protein